MPGPFAGPFTGRSPAWLAALLLVVLAGCVTTSGSDSREQAIDDHVKLGLSYLQEGNRQDARRHLQRAMEIDSRSARAHHGMALLMQLELENELAEQHFRKAISYDRDFTRARNNYAVFLYGQERYKDAYEQLVEAGEDINYRNRYQVFYSLGVVSARLGRFEEAKAAWEKSLALSPRYALPYLELAEYHLQQNDLITARKYLEAFDKLSQPQARSLWLAVQIEDGLGNRDAVASKGLALTKLFPNSQETRLYRAWLKNDQDN